jgi:hypothetical protein
MSSEHDGNDRATEPDSPGDGPGGVSFDAIVASWKAEGTVPEWPGGPQDLTPPAAPVAPAPAVPASEPQVDPEDHYVPPEPPPLPRVGAAAAVGLVLVALGIVLIAAPQWLGMSSVYGLPLGLVAIAGGLTWLLMRLWQPTGEDDPFPDDGTL